MSSDLTLLSLILVAAAQAGVQTPPEPSRPAPGRRAEKSKNADERVEALEAAIRLEISLLEKRLAALKEHLDAGRSSPAAETSGPDRKPAPASRPTVAAPDPGTESEAKEHETLLRDQALLVEHWREHTRQAASEGQPETARATHREEAARAREKLRQVLHRSLALRESARARQLERLRRELESLERELDERRDDRNREQAVEARLSELLEGSLKS